MTTELRYGRGGISVELPDGRTDAISAVPTLPAVTADETAIVLGAIARSATGLEEFLEGSSSVAIVVSDHTRNTGGRVYVPLLMDIARKKGRRLSVIVALGLHRPSAAREIAEILGAEPDPDVAVINHDADGLLAECGEGRFCAELVKADRIILTGSVTFHPMAGYSGGWKSVLPGLASREDIVRNHRLYFADGGAAPGIGPASVEGNPVLDDIRRRTRGFAGRIWCLNVVQDEAKSIVFASAGAVDEAWEACTAYLASRNAPRIYRRYPVVIASAGGHPYDFSFYQSMKTLTNASRACERGGRIFLVMECGNGWELDERDMELAGLPPREIAPRLLGDFSMGGLAIYMAMSVIKDYRVACLSSLPGREVGRFGMRPVSTGAELSALIAAEGADRIAVIPASAAVLPVYRGGSHP